MSHSQNKRQLSIKNLWSCILHDHGVARMYELRTVLLTALVLLNITHKKKNIDSKLTDVAPCKVLKNVLLDVSWAILIKYSYGTAKARALYEYTDERSGQHGDNLPNSDGLGTVHWTVPELTFQVYWWPGLPIWGWFSSDPDLDLKRQSRTVANTTSVDLLTLCFQKRMHTSFPNKISWISEKMLSRCFQWLTAWLWQKLLSFNISLLCIWFLSSGL